MTVIVCICNGYVFCIYLFFIGICRLCVFRKRRLSDQNANYFEQFNQCETSARMYEVNLRERKHT